MDVAAAAQRWADVWERAWPAADVEAIRVLYADDAVFHSHPFRPHQAPADYVVWAFEDQRAAVCRFGDPLAAGDRAAVDWWAVVTDRDGADQALAGTSLLRFRADGLVVEQRDAWGEEAGARDLPAWAPKGAASAPPVRQLRLCVTTDDFDEALRVYRDVLGLRELEAYSSDDGRVSILDAGRATLELLDPTHAAFVDQVEVGRRVAGHVRVALEVADAVAVTADLEAAGATVVAPPARTPWRSLNARLEAPAGLQLTLFTEPTD